MTVAHEVSRAREPINRGKAVTIIRYNRFNMPFLKMDIYENCE